MHQNINTAIEKNIYHCGSLTYTRVGLVMLFTWLLWGEFCFCIMEKVVPSILPLKLKDLGCPNWLMGMILSSLPGFFNMTVCPWVSFKSDRFRSRWGRRIPFMITTLPFLCISLVFLGCSDSISLFLIENVPALRSAAPATLTIALIAFFLAMFEFFNMFVGSVFYYLFNDVVPAQFLGRFMAAFKIIGVAAGTVYNYFIFQYAESHMREIYIGSAILYAVGFTMMCLMVKEGKYPDVEGECASDYKGWGGLKTFFKESFRNKFYWLIFMFTGISGIANIVMTFDVFFKREMGLNLDQIGKLAAVLGIGTIIATFFAAIFIDRWHPIRIIVYSAVFNLIILLMNWKWIYITLPSEYYFWLSLGTGLLSAFHAALQGMAGMPLYMRIFPRSRFGQFCSAQALLRSVCTIVAGVAAGLFIDIVKWFCSGGDFAYRFIFIWTFVFSVVGSIVVIYLYISWYKLGGDKHFHPPAPWSPHNMEKLPIVTTIGPQTRWMKVSLYIFDSIMVISTLSIPFLMFYMYQHNVFKAFSYFGLLLLPMSAGAWMFWIMIRRSISGDIKRVLDGLRPLNGFPHHGLLIIVAIKYLALVLLCVVQIVISVNLQMEKAAVLFGLANIVTNFLLTGTVWLFARIERGRLVTLDENLA